MTHVRTGVMEIGLKSACFEGPESWNWSDVCLFSLLWNWGVVHGEVEKAYNWFAENRRNIAGS